VEWVRLDHGRLAWGVLLATLLGVVAWDFLAATTFLGDDHLFLAYARLAPHPFVALVTDQHGGEYYRPLPMALWWVLVHLAGERHWVFGLLALFLHAATAGLTGVLALRLGLGVKVALVAAALFLAAPAGREAASWFSASTDLLATAFTVASMVCLIGGGRGAYVASVGLAGLAYLSKESALALPLLAVAATVVARPAAIASGHAPPPCPPPLRGGGRLRAAVPHAVLAVLYLVVRFAVLGGAGGSGDDQAPVWARGLQIGAGLVHALVGEHVLPEPMLWILGAATLGWGVWAVRGDRRLLFPVLWMLLALAPLPAAGWVVGARYFYLPAVGLALLVASRLEARGPAVAVVAIAFLLALGTGRAALRRGEIARYQARVEAAADAVAAGLRLGHRLFHVQAGIKDLDLVLKGHPSLGGRDDFLALGDVPASFVLVPPALVERTRFLRADPPLPPSGAYRFGARSIVGLARRHESPDLEVVVKHLPELRFIQLVTRAGGVAWRDVTREKVEAR
jgi:hypothetical protein